MLIRTDDEYHDNFRFADDINILSDTPENLQRTIEELHTESVKEVMKTNL